MDWEFAKIVADLENAKKILHNLGNLDFRRTYIAKYLNGYQLDEITFIVLIAELCVDRIIRMLKAEYERKLNKKDER